MITILVIVCELFDNISNRIPTRDIHKRSVNILSRCYRIVFAAWGVILLSVLLGGKSSAFETEQLGIIKCLPINIDKNHLDYLADNQIEAVNAVNAFLRASNLEKAMRALNTNSDESQLSDSNFTNSPFGHAFVGASQNNIQTDSQLRASVVLFTGVTFTRDPRTQGESFILHASINDFSNVRSFGSIQTRVDRDAEGIGHIKCVIVDVVEMQETIKTPIRISDNSDPIGMIVHTEPVTTVHYEFNVDDNDETQGYNFEKSVESTPSLFQITHISKPSIGLSSDEKEALELIEKVTALLNKETCLIKLFDSPYLRFKCGSTETKYFIQSISYNDGIFDIKRSYRRNLKTMSLCSSRSIIRFSLQTPTYIDGEELKSQSISNINLNVNNVKIEDTETGLTICFSFHSNGMLKELCYRASIEQVTENNDDNVPLVAMFYQMSGGIPVKRIVKWDEMGNLISDEKPVGSSESLKNFGDVLHFIK